MDNFALFFSDPRPLKYFEIITFIFALCKVIKNKVNQFKIKTCFQINYVKYFEYGHLKIVKILF